MTGWRGGGARGSAGSAGSAAIEMAIVMPMFVVLFTAAVVLGRTGTTISAVEMAAYDAARTASLAREFGTAEAQAKATVRQRLADRGVSCLELDVTVSGAAEFAQPVGTPASVTATVSCRVTYGDVDLIGVPADRTVAASFTSPLDQYRTRR